MGARLFSSRAPPLYERHARVFSIGPSARSSRHETLWNTGQRFARSAGRLSTYSRTNVQKRWLTCMDGCSYRSSRPLRSKTRSGAEGDSGTLAPAAAEADRLRAAGVWSKTGRAPPCGSMRAGSCAATGPACGTGAPTLAARRASDLGASRLLASLQTSAARAGWEAAIGTALARAWMAAWAGVWDGRVT